MPKPRCFGHKCEMDMLKLRKLKDNRQKKIRYWRLNYGVDVNDEQYEMFSKYSINIKKILPILDFIKTINISI
jgi:hypothetical protein